MVNIPTIPLKGSQLQNRGAITNTESVIAWCTSAGATKSITIPIGLLRGLAVNDLTNVSISNLVDQQVLQYVASNNEWRNFTVGGDGTITTGANLTVTGINTHSLGDTTPTAGNLIIGSGTNWVSHIVSGDATLGSGGVVTVTQINGTPLGSTTPTNANILIANGTNWSTHAMSGDSTMTNAGVVTVGKINGGLLGTTTPTSGNILIGSGTQWGTQALSGDVTMTNTGVATVGAINTHTLGNTTPTSGNLLIGSGTTWATQALSGDITVNSTGVTTLKNTGPGAGAHTLSNVTIDAQGRVTAISNGSTALSALTDVSIGTLANGNVLVYNSTDVRWENKGASAVGGLIKLGSGTVNTSSSPSVDFRSFASNGVYAEFIFLVSNLKAFVASDTLNMGVLSGGTHLTAASYFRNTAFGDSGPSDANLSGSFHILAGDSSDNVAYDGRGEIRLLGFSTANINTVTATYTMTAICSGASGDPYVINGLGTGGWSDTTKNANTTIDGLFFSDSANTTGHKYTFNWILYGVYA